MQIYFKRIGVFETETRFSSKRVTPSNGLPLAWGMAHAASWIGKVTLVFGAVP